MKALNWLLDPSSPGVRYLALRDLLDLPPDDPELMSACQAAHGQGPIAAVLAEMHPEGYWEKPGPGYNPKYRSTVWSLILLTQLGAQIASDGRIARACAYILEQSLTPHGQFSASGAPSGTVDCLQGNLCMALVALGCEDPRLDLAYEWMARSVTGEGIAPISDKNALLRYYSGKCGPLFACGANDKLACAWGAAKVMLAFSLWPRERRTPLIERAIAQGIDFLFSRDPAEADYPSGWTGRPSGNWWKFGFPVFYITDLLQIVEALVGLGYAHDPRLQNALHLIQSKQDSQGRWALDYDYTGKTWGDYGAKKQPNPWVTLRARRVLKAAGMV
ncbi:MAG: hypothetical protein JXB15_05305 [Anaerolineales bacterium]|nr:hypothetical protein [Anaerolineales bacterium]